MTRHLLILICGLCLSCFVQKTYAQQSITVSGKVINKETKKAKANVDILSSNLRERLGVSADDGSFSLTIPAGTTVVFKYVDMEDFSRTFFKNEKDIVINMFPSSNEMKQVVVTGFKKVTRETMTGASTVISGKDIQDVPVSNITQLLQGKVAGLNVQVNNGMPGARTSMFLRGLSSANVTGSGAGAFMTPTSPLFVVDGVEVDDNANYQYGFDQAGPGISPLSAIPPEDVQSIEVLKDAQATALYGSRGAYGVILITTKRGNSSIPIVQYSGSYFVNTVPKLRDVIGGRNERDIRLNEIMGFDSSYAAAYALINGTNFLSDSLSPYWNNSTNWQSLFYRNTSNQSHNVNISGGNQQFNYKVNMGYYHENGILQNT
ncbi:TonB-dependent receptor plug domain-containing protein, partial [Arachidicoccus sp.]|uniref:TonB-dependent receptor plug domain-containing protein n=1 Tax=Arachidicoccus sp. TaxID=1872624 RepID=UPI003D1B9683